MRVLIAVLVVPLLLAGCAASQHAAAPSRSITADVAPVAMSEAMSQLGAPHYRHECEDGGRVLAWKVVNTSESRRPGVYYSQVVEAASFRALRPLGGGEQEAVMAVMVVDVEVPAGQAQPRPHYAKGVDRVALASLGAGTGGAGKPILVVDVDLHTGQAEPRRHYAEIVQPASTLALRPWGDPRERETLVVKFDAGGRMLWGRRLP